MPSAYLQRLDEWSDPAWGILLASLTAMATSTGGVPAMANECSDPAFASLLAAAGAMEASSGGELEQSHGQC